MNDANPVRSVRSPVRRSEAEFYLLLMLLSFAGSVVGTRLFLELTGYPQIGNSELHIAHVLWGGLLLFAGALLPLIFANRWAFTSGAVCSGLGVGLFIDEIGKFITQSNDYFYPLAAPLIYAFFLLTVLIYLQVRRRAQNADIRAGLYNILADFQEVLDHDLSSSEHRALEGRLERIAAQPSPEYAALAGHLLEFLRTEYVRPVPDRPNLWQQLLEWGDNFESRWLNRRLNKTILVVGLGVTGLLVISTLVLSLQALESVAFVETVPVLATQQPVQPAASGLWYILSIFLEGGIGILLFVACLILALRNERLGTNLAFAGLVLSLTVVNLLGFYFSQFAAVAAALLQFTLLFGVIRYRRRFLDFKVGDK